MRLKIIFIVFLLTPLAGFSQKDTLLKRLDSLGITSDSLKNGGGNNINSTAYNEATRINLHNYLLLLASDFKQQVTLPFHTKKKDWIRIAEFGGLLGAVSFADEPISRSAAELKNKNSAVRSASKYITKFGGLYEVYTLAGIATYGILFKDRKIQTTALLATQSYLTAGALQIALKYLTARQRPSYIDKKENENEPTFHGPFFHFGGKSNSGDRSSSFPSGHTTAAFAAATVFAMEYRNKSLVPILSYSAATLIGLSRLTENKHWPTDILAGAALGFLSGKQVINNYHRFSKLRQLPKKHPGSLSFNIRYFYGRLLPEARYNL